MRAWRSVLLVVLGLVSIAATRLVAMRVEVVPLRAEGDRTVVALTVQVAPEDRARVGQSVWLELELRRGDSVVEQSGRAAELDESGAATVEAAWPPGRYELRVDLGAAGGSGGGFWRGAVEVPVLERKAPSAEPETGPAAPQPEAPALEPPRPAPTSRPVPPTAETEPRAPAAAAPGEVRPAPAAAEAPPSAEPQFVAATTPKDAELAWAGDAPGLAELTFFATAASRPVSGLEGPRLRLRVDGREAAIAALGGAGEAPLSLVIAVDLSSTMAPVLPQLRERLARLALRVSGAGGSVAVITAAAEPVVAAEWGATPSAVAAALGEVATVAEGDLAGLVKAAVGSLERRRGRLVVVLFSDGGDAAARSAWKEVLGAVDGAGAPVLVVAVRTEALEERTRRSLERIASISGGTIYVVRPRDVDLLGMVVDQFARLADSSYALAFARPGDATAPLRIDLDAGPGVEVHHPRSVR